MTAPDTLPDDIAELKAIIRAKQDQNAQFEALLASFKKAFFWGLVGEDRSRSIWLELEEIETAIAQVEAGWMQMSAQRRCARPSRAKRTGDRCPSI
ncbi:MAG: hypothetical protein RIE06_03415 [Roseibium album]